MGADKPKFVLFLVDVDPRFAQSAFAVTYGLDFGPDEHDTHFEGFIYKIEMARLAVLDNGRTRFFFGHL